ncbi:MAG TPA: MFS transporter [Rhodopila sp.]|uniref:MFS transporter n=1 Tax=Rhodopila sp. TaxID=2480087 RepID=UPI002D15C088|nr:MFS transporter [Rhodopila sp.]HVY18261.1 MFS transporter [Rhodopila sp.]
MTAKSATRRVMWFFAIVYAVEGIGQAKAGILGQPITYYLKQVMGWEPVQISASLAVLDVPWVIKPLWGAISDFVPLFGYRRRTWLVAANLLGIGAFAWVAILGGGTLLVPALVVTALAMAVSSTLCGALLVETGQKHNGSASFVNQQWLWFNIAQMLAVLLAGWLIEVMSPSGALRASAWIAAVAPMAIIGSVWMIEEDRAAIDLASLRVRFVALLTAFRTRNLYLVMGFLFLYYFSPGFGTPLYFVMTDQLHFSQGFIGILSSIGAGGWILGGLLHKTALTKLSHPALLRLSILGGVVATLAYLLLVGPVSAVLISILGGVTSMIAFIATLSLAADSCPEGAEGFAFAGMMSILNLAQPLGDTLGSVLYEHVFDHRLPALIVVSAVATGLVIFLVPYMSFRPSEPAMEAPVAS